MARLECACTYWNPFEEPKKYDLTKKLVPGMEYEIRITAAEMQEFPAAEDDTFTEQTVTYHMKDVAKVTMPLQPSALRNRKPVIMAEQSATVVDGYITVHWAYAFDDFLFNDDEVRPIIQNHFINWGSNNQDLYLSRELGANARSARIGPLEPGFKYFVYVDVSYKGSQNNIEKSLNFYIEKNQVYNYTDPKERKRPLGVAEFTAAPKKASQNNSYSAVRYSYKAPLVDRNQFLELRIFYPDNSTRLLHLNPGKIKSYKQCRSNCRYKLSRTQYFDDDYAPRVFRNHSFSAQMKIVDFRNVDSMPSFAVYLPEDELAQYGTILPDCQFVFMNAENANGKMEVHGENDEITLKWHCQQKVHSSFLTENMFFK